MLNTVAGSLGLTVQAAMFLGVYLAVAPRRGRSLALLYAALAAVNGYALMVLGAMTVGVPWQVANFVLVACPAASLASSRVRTKMTRSTRSLRQLLSREWVTVAIVMLVVGAQTVVIVVLPEVSIDGQLYHGPVLAELVQNGTLWGWTAPNQYMYYSDLAMVSGLNLTTFTGATWLDNGVQLPHLLILMLVLNVALRSRFSRAWVRMALAALIVSAPVIWIQARVLYVDIAYGAAVAALIVLIVTVRCAGGVDILFAAVSGAAILALKPTGLITSALLVLILLAISIWRRRRSGRTWSRTIWVALPALAVPCVLALGFYIRNLLTFGNPVYPVKVSIGPVALPGVIDLSVFASGDRGSGLVDPLRWVTYVMSMVEGARRGVTKTDYDPRAGGYGYLPLVILVILVVMVAVQLVVTARRKRRGGRSWRGNALVQGRLVALAALVLLVQPSTFDSRYVMGPTVVFAAAALLTTVLRRDLLRLDAAVGIFALLAASVQIAWTEVKMYPGAAWVEDLANAEDVWQPSTPGNMWGRATTVQWMPDDAFTCSRIALQTDGGVTEGGLKGTSFFGTLPYSLYGAGLCNKVTPVQIDVARTEPEMREELIDADFLLLYADDLATWQQVEPEAQACWEPLQTLDASADYPKAVIVLSNTCR